MQRVLYEAKAIFLHLTQIYSFSVKVISSIENYVPDRSCVLTIGTFDGVHLGHRKIIDRLVTRAKQGKHLSVVLTFFPHPRMVLQKDQSIKLIDTLEEKKEFFTQLGVDVLVIHPFSKEFSRQTSSRFIRDILVNTFQIAHLIIGYDHRFGRNREATVEDLELAGQTYGFTVEQIEAQEISSVNVSSTKIRRALAEGDVKKAANYLQRPFVLQGKVAEGDQIGRTIGFPTANLNLEENYKLLPADGVYFIRTEIDEQTHHGMMNIGYRPTMKGKKHRLEVHLFEFQKDLYGQVLRVELLDFIRKEKKFDSPTALKSQLEVDKQQCLNLIP